ncbi:hypothetical protein [Spongiimicrobium sp. 3-5]|uniref:hypothetical protein n=1 Tax=Spongiimicrobium sp. 3-5 TaxID=3332596 RepID=UPI003980CCFD
MRNYIFYFIYFILFSCSPQDSKIEDLKGNWYLQYQVKFEDEYFELYINEELIYYYSSQGMLKPLKYKIENGELFVENRVSGKLENKGAIHYSNGVFTIEIFNEKISLLRIDNEPFVEDIIKGRIKEKDYRNYFHKRYSKWLGE